MAAATATDDAAAVAAELPAWNAYDFGEACATGKLARVRELTSPEHMAAHSGVDLNAMAFLGATGLYWACRDGHIEVVRYLTSPAMLAAGVDVNKGSSGGTSPLAIAVFHGRVEVVRHLLESPDLAAAGIAVDVNAAKNGWTALHCACYGSAPPEVVSMLLRQPQLDMGTRDTDGKTALQVAEEHTEPGGHGAEKAALIREAMRLPMARLYVLVVAMWSRREGRVAAPAAASATGAGAGARAGAGAAPAVPAGTLDEEDEEARARRRLMGSLPPAVLATACALASGGVPQ